MLLVNSSPSPSAVINHHGSGVVSHSCSNILRVKMARTPSPSVRRSSRLLAYDERSATASDFNTCGPLISVLNRVITPKSSGMKFWALLFALISKIHRHFSHTTDVYLESPRVPPAGIWASGFPDVICDVMALWHLALLLLSCFFGTFFTRLSSSNFTAGEWAASIPPAEACLLLLLSTVWPCDFGGVWRSWRP